MHRFPSILAVFLSWACPAYADMRIELHDGRSINIPVDHWEIDRLTLNGMEFELVPADGSRGVPADGSRGVPANGSRGERVGGPLAEVPTMPSRDESGRRILRVGPGRDYALPSEAAADARDGDIVEIDAGLYRGDVAGWPQSDLTIRAVGGRAHVDAARRGHAGKGLWVVSGDNVTIEGMELSGCVVDDHNCAAIRAEGSNLTLRDVHIHHNEMGVLTSQDYGGRLLIERSRINDNLVDHDKFGIPPAHNVYASGGELLVVTGSWIHNPHAGHNIKSRAAETVLLFNRIEDGPDSAGSYQIDTPDGGRVLIMGNLVSQAADAGNGSIIAYASERYDGGGSLELIHNTIVNHRHAGIFVANRSPVIARLTNNLIVGKGDLTVGAADQAGNVRTDIGSFRDGVVSREAVDAGVAAGSVPGFVEAPRWEYSHPTGLEPRRVRGAAPDAGALEMPGAG